MAMPTSLQKNIKRHLRQQRISIAELERRTGIKHAIMNILHGRTKSPTLRVAKAIAKELGCSVEDLFNESYLEPKTLDVRDTTLTPQEWLHWHGTLFLQTSQYVDQWLTQHKLQCDYAQALQAIQEIYEYSLNNPMQQVDTHFADWFLKKCFAQKERGR